MKKTIATIFLATALTIGAVSASSFLSPGGGVASLQYAHVASANSTTTINSGGPGIFNSIVFDSPAVSSTSVITIFDGTISSNTIIDKFTLVDGANPVPSFDVLGVRYQNGLTAQETGATTTFTISYQ